MRQRPFAAFFFIELAVDARAHILAPVVQLFLERVFEDLALFLDHQDLFEASREIARDRRFERPDHIHFVQPDADLAAGVVVEAEVGERLARIEIGLARTHDPEARVRAVDHVVIELVRAHISEHRVELVIEQPRFLRERRVGPADVQAVGRHREIGRQHDLHAVRIDDDRRRRLDHIGHCLHADPQARITAHGPAVQAEVEVFLHRARKEHRKAGGLEHMVGLVRQGRTLGAVVVAGHHQHTAMAAGAGGVRMLEHIAATVHARAFAVPHRKHAVVFLLRVHRHLLGAPARGGREVFIDPGLEHHMVLLEVFLGLPTGLVDTAQRRAAIAGDEARGVQARGQIAHALEHGQTHQRLGAAHIGAAAFKDVFVVERNRREGVLQLGELCLGERSVHALSPDGARTGGPRWSRLAAALVARGVKQTLKTIKAARANQSAVQPRKCIERRPWRRLPPASGAAQEGRGAKM